VPTDTCSTAALMAPSHGLSHAAASASTAIHTGVRDRSPDDRLLALSPRGRARARAVHT
jgi:hypothetical protein